MLTVKIWCIYICLNEVIQSKNASYISFHICLQHIFFLFITWCLAHAQVSHLNTLNCKNSWQNSIDGPDLQIQDKVSFLLYIKKCLIKRFLLFIKNEFITFNNIHNTLTYNASMLTIIKLYTNIPTFYQSFYINVKYKNSATVLLNIAWWYPTQMLKLIS